jgi:hypothetical protein
VPYRPGHLWRDALAEHARAVDGEETARLAAACLRVLDPAGLFEGGGADADEGGR